MPPSNHTLVWRQIWRDMKKERQEPLHKGFFPKRDLRFDGEGGGDQMSRLFGAGSCIGKRALVPEGSVRKDTLNFYRTNPPPGGVSFFGCFLDRGTPLKNNPDVFKALGLFFSWGPFPAALHLETTRKGNLPGGGGSFDQFDAA